MSTVDTQKSAMGARLRWAREQAGLSQGQVAKLLDMHRPTITNIEGGSRSVKADEIARFADLYDVKGDWLLRGDEVFDREADPRVQLAARELSKLGQDDLDTIFRLVRVLRSNKE